MFGMLNGTVKYIYAVFIKGRDVAARQTADGESAKLSVGVCYSVCYAVCYANGCN